jgi:hypothetical protein
VVQVVLPLDMFNGVSSAASEDMIGYFGDRKWRQCRAELRLATAHTMSGCQCHTQVSAHRKKHARRLAICTLTRSRVMSSTGLVVIRSSSLLLYFGAADGAFRVSASIIVSELPRIRLASAPEAHSNCHGVGAKASPIM